MSPTETLGTEEPQDMTGENGSQHTHIEPLVTSFRPQSLCFPAPLAKLRTTNP